MTDHAGRRSTGTSIGLWIEVGSLGGKVARQGSRDAAFTVVLDAVGGLRTGRGPPGVVYAHDTTQLPRTGAGGVLASEAMGVNFQATVYAVLRTNLPLTLLVPHDITAEKAWCGCLTLFPRRSTWHWCVLVPGWASLFDLAASGVALSIQEVRSRTPGSPRLAFHELSMEEAPSSVRYELGWHPSGGATHETIGRCHQG